MTTPSLLSRRLNAFKAEMKLVMPKSLFQIFYLCFTGFAGLYLYRPMKELDFFWRIRLGEALITNSEIEVNTLPTWGNFDADWRTTQPLGEVILFAIHKLGGLEFISVGRIAVWTFIVWRVYRLLIVEKNPRDSDSSTQFFLTAYALISVYLLLPFIQERPQSIMLLLLIIAAPNLTETFLNPRGTIKASTWLIISMATFIHPAWVIMFGFILLNIVRNVSQRHRKWSREGFLLLVIPTLPILGPSGVNYYRNSIEISRLGRSYISEWQPLWRMDVSQPVLVFFCFQLLFVIIISIILASSLSPRSTISFLGLLIALQIFAILAVRNLPIATILSIALLNTVLALQQKDLVHLKAHDLKNTFQKYSNIEGVPTCLRIIPIGFLIFTLTAGVVKSFKASEDFSRIAPIGILQSMKELGAVKVVNSSNEGGYVHYFAGGLVTPFIDGRIDRYSRGQFELLARLFSSETGAKELESVELSQATEILIQRESSLRPREDSGYRFICQENGYLWFSRQTQASCGRG